MNIYKVYSWIFLSLNGNASWNRNIFIILLTDELTCLRPLTASKVHKRSQALTHAQAEQLVNIDRELRSNSLPSHQQQQPQQLSKTAPLIAADISDNKRRGQ